MNFKIVLFSGGKKFLINFLQNRNSIAKGIDLRIQSSWFKQTTTDYKASQTFTLNGQFLLVSLS